MPLLRLLLTLSLAPSLAFGAQAATAQTAPPAAPPAPPNIVVIILDDWGWRESGAYGNANIQTPHIDKLARRVEKQAKVVHDEADKHFPKATALHRHARELEKLGDHLHDLAHRKGEARHMRADVKKMHDLVHDLEGHLDGLRPLNDEARRALKHMREAVSDVHDSVKHLQKHLKE